MWNTLKSGFNFIVDTIKVLWNEIRNSSSLEVKGMRFVICLMLFGFILFSFKFIISLIISLIVFKFIFNRFGNLFDYIDDFFKKK